MRRECPAAGVFTPFRPITAVGDRQYGGGVVAATRPVGVVTVRVPSGSSCCSHPGAWCLPRWSAVQ